MDTVVVIFLMGTLAALAAIAVGGIYICLCFVPKIVRIFEEKPLLAAISGDPPEDAEEVSFRTADGLELRGSYWKTAASVRSGVVLCCHEFSGTRWSSRAYCEHLHRAGFDVFTFDFRNHGQSDSLDSYEPLQWVTEYEVEDVRAALRYLSSRPDRPPQGVGVYGISKGGSAALVAAAESPHVAAVVTDSAFPTRGMQLAYMRRWRTIYSNITIVHPWLNDRVHAFLARWARQITERRRRCRFVDVEEAVSQFKTRRLLMVHGERDRYVTTEVARTLFSFAPVHAELWMVAGARHNESLRIAGDAYRTRVRRFFENYAGAAPQPVRRKRVLEPAS